MEQKVAPPIHNDSRLSTSDCQVHDTGGRTGPSTSMSDASSFRGPLAVRSGARCFRWCIIYGTVSRDVPSNAQWRVLRRLGEVVER